MGPSWAHAFLVAALITLGCTPLLRRVALATDFVDRPVAAHKSHKHATPYLGGIGLIAAVLTGLLFTDRLTPLVAVIALGGALIGSLGLLDDHLSIGAVIRFGFEITVAAVALAVGLRIHATDIAAIDGLLTIIWIVGVTNAVNFLDNMDGLAAGVSAAAATAVFALAVLGEQLVTATLAAGLAGACIGFLFHNKRPASIFMGDTGSLFLGFVLAVASLEVSPALTPPVSFAVPLLLLALPVLDTVTVTICRLRRGRSVALGGKDHLSHRLVARGLSPGIAVGVLVGVEGVVGLAAVAAGRQWFPLESAVLLAGAALAVLTLATVRAQVYAEPVAGFPKRLKQVALIGTSGVVLLAAPAMFALARAYAPSVSGADDAKRGLEALAAGDAARATRHFAEADQDLQRADQTLSGPLTSLGLLVPGLRANVATSRAVVAAGQTLADAGASLSALVDASNMALGPGSDPTAEATRLAPALSASVAALDRSASLLAGYDRPYLLPALGTAVRDLRSGLAEASAGASLAADAVRLMPVMLGQEGPRRYFLAVQDSAELRGGGGVAHMWGELVAERGRLRLTRFGAVAELNNAGPARKLIGPDIFSDRYREFDVANTWENVNVSPDFAVTGTVISSLYRQSDGLELDGVIAVDLPGLAALLDLIGPVEVDGWPVPVTGPSVVDVFLRHAHDRFPSVAGYEAFVRRLSEETVEAFTTADLGTPARVGSVLGNAVREGHLLLFSPRAEEERLFERLGAAGRVPAVAGDSLLVVNQNLTARQTDAFLRRQIRYEVALDPGRQPAALSGRVEVILHNDLPAESPAWIATRENRTYVSVYSPSSLGNAVDGISSGPELGRQAHAAIVSVPSQEHRTLALDLRGSMELGPDNWYHLDLSHQTSLSPDLVDVSLAIPSGWRIAEVRGMSKVDDRHAEAHLSVSNGQRLSVRLERTGWSRLWSRLQR